jgi:hypothetical protein
MTTLTQGPRAAEFILSEANGQRSRENGSLLSGENLTAGTVLMAAGTKLVKYEVDTTGSAAIGVLIHDTDATGGDVACSYIARDAEVKREFLVGPGDTDGDAEVEASLKLVGIIVR